MSKVSIVKFKGNLEEAISEALFSVIEQASLKDKSILVKVNTCRPGYARGQVTDPEFLKATLRILKQSANDITICESG